MKPKKFDKKLNLGKTTVANLGTGEEAKIRGGYFNTACDQTCYTWCAGCVTRRQICGYTPAYTDGPSCIVP
jgi:hypothetical protein